MRKLLLIVILAIGYIANAQEEIRSYAVDVSFDKNRSGEWKWKKQKVCHVIFTISGNNIMTNDLAGSFYITYENLSVSSREATWLAKDEKNRECTVKIEYGISTSCLTITYPDSCFKYYFKD
jgi:hypothetical protein